MAANVIKPHWTLAQRLAFYAAPPNDRGCILWLGSRNEKGYGRLWWEGRIRGAHRLAWTLANGPIPAGLLVCHKCDVPSCVNPDHLFVGTNRDNMVDMARKGRLPEGRAKITEAIARAIRADPRILREVSHTYGLSISHVHRIKRGDSWSHLT